MTENHPTQTSPIDLRECSDCQDLGRCCHFQTIINDVAVYSSHSCPFLKDGMCSVYEDRLERAPWCGKVTNPDISWPTFCPHHRARGNDVMYAGEFHSIHGVPPHTKEGLTRLIELIDHTVEDEVQDEFGLDLRSFE